MDQESNGLSFLIDSNVILEMLLKQSRAPECLGLFSMIGRGEVTAIITIFALHSIEVIMCAWRRFSVLETFIEHIDSLENMIIFQMNLPDERKVISLVQETRLDFDDALQYYAAKQTDATLVSFDKHFDKTDIKRLEPGDILG